MAINPKSILKVEDIDNARLDSLLKSAVYRENEYYGLQVAPKLWALERPPILATLFFEPSTRTKMSFETAMLSLGGRIINLDQNSSLHKGESEADTIKTVSQYADVMVVRHPEVGSVGRLAAYSNVPVINAGDGGNEHPTQALLDLYTIQKHKKPGQSLTIMFSGDLQYSRTINSLVKLLHQSGMYNLNLIYVGNANEELNTYPHIQIKLHPFRLDSYLSKVDVWYITRIQKERYSNEKEMPLSFGLNTVFLNRLKPDAIIMHPLPRNEEIDSCYDEDARIKCFEQVKNGVFMRMAILQDCLG